MQSTREVIFRLRAAKAIVHLFPQGFAAQAQTFYPFKFFLCNGPYSLDLARERARLL